MGNVFQSARAILLDEINAFVLLICSWIVSGPFFIINVFEWFFVWILFFCLIFPFFNLIISCGWLHKEICSNSEIEDRLIYSASRKINGSGYLYFCDDFVISRFNSNEKIWVLWRTYKFEPSEKTKKIVLDCISRKKERDKEVIDMKKTNKKEILSKKAISEDFD